MSYHKLPIEEFGRQLITSLDLDPIYPTLVDMKMPKDKLYRWLLGYWCFYNAGFASYISEYEGSDYWKQMLIAAENAEPTPFGSRWPRGSERRHFRGNAAISAVESYKEKYNQPEEMVDYIVGQGDNTYQEVAARTTEHRLFGPWISFKVADMIDRVLNKRVNFDSASVFMFTDPVKGAKMVYDSKHNDLDVPEQEKIDWSVAYLREEYKDLMAPPFYDRKIELQEIETCLCKWKSHMNGRYPIGNDIKEIKHGLSAWVDTVETAYLFDKSMPVLNEMTIGLEEFL